MNVIDLAAYREKREQAKNLSLLQQREYDRAVQQSRKMKPTSMWNTFVTTYQLLPFKRKDDQ